MRQHIRALQEFEIDIREYVPFINMHAAIPFLSRKLRLRHILPLPFYAALQALKLISRIPGAVGTYGHDITWLSRTLMPGYLTLEPFLKKPLIFDVDDAIWLTKPFGKQAVSDIARRADVIFAGNQYIADWMGQYSQRIYIVPTAVDSEIYKPAEEKALSGDGFIIGWIGSSGTLPYLEAIEDPLNEFLLKYGDASILVMADRPPSFKKITGEKIKYIPWTETEEVSTLQKMDVGLMPLPDDEWTRGKCAFKMVQYMSCAVPVIVSPVGMNAEVLGLGEAGFSAVKNTDWYDSLEYIYMNRDKAQEIGRNARAIVLRNFDRRLITQQIAGIMMSLL
jgi:glycosyltransferase involved in cell wall biosynthesis